MAMNGDRPDPPLFELASCLIGLALVSLAIRMVFGDI